MRNFSADQIATDDEVPELDVPFARIRSPKYGANVYGHVVTPRCLHVYTHYYLGRTIPHLNDRSICEGCQAERAKRYKGYLGCIEPGTGNLVLVELTQHAAAAWKDTLGSKGPSLRGAVVTTIRVGRAPNSLMRLEIRLNAVDPKKLREEYAILPVLRKLWAGESYTKRSASVGPATLDMIPS